MSLPRLVWRHLWSHPLRSLLTVGAVAVAIFLFCFVRSIVTTLDAAVKESATNRVIVTSAVSLFQSLPLARVNVHSSVVSVGALSPATTLPVARSRMTSTASYRNMLYLSLKAQSVSTVSSPLPISVLYFSVQFQTHLGARGSGLPLMLTVPFGPAGSSTVQRPLPQGTTKRLGSLIWVSL